MDLNSWDNVKEIVDGCIKGDTQCQRVLYENLYRKMLGVCMRYSSCTEEAEDLLHDGFIKVFEKMKYYKHSGSLEGWIRRVIVNNAIDYLRKRKHEFLSREDDNVFENIIDDEDDNISEMKIANMQAERILELIQKLSPSYRAVFNLYVIENYSHKEISEMLGISIGSSKSNLSKAKAKLRILYNEEYSNNHNETI
ncbi:MAG: RNA polymerase sigma factor [Bacteroidales bacterium]|nr:RNA polymerase sigma factor [Bacteroidales bacterium]